MDASTHPVAAAPPAGANHDARTQRLGLGLLGLYGSGALVQDTIVFALGQLLLFYLTVVCGLSGSAAGLALAVALVVDSLIDPLVGSLSDNSRSRHGRRHPFMIISAVPTVLAFALLFSVPPGLSGVALFAYALVMLLAARIGLSGFQVPYIALGAELSDDYAERSTIVASRVFFTVLAGLLAAFLAYGVFLKGPGGQTHRAAYAPYAWTCGVIVLTGAALSSFGTLGARDRLHAAAPGQGAALGRLLAEVAEVFKNRSFRVLFAACLILFVAIGASGALGLHANTYFWKLPTSAILLVALSTPIGTFFGIFIATALSRVLEKRILAMCGIGLIGVCQFLPATFKVAGVIPHGVLPGEAALITAGIFGGVGAAAALIGFQSMMADAADEHEHLFAARREGLYFAGLSLSAKASTGIGALIAGVVLDLIGFPHGPAAAHVANIAPETIRNLGLAHGPGASLLTAASVITLTLYRRGRRDHEAVQSALAERREAAAGR
jgi:GPH family glycoside/pentoside/hexuronide:cation symporter